ncbi:MAG: hypothetical protein CMI67_17805 [Pelagibaca sp.]|nr:hypothetical protein [Pelagibaca sp.]
MMQMIFLITLPNECTSRGDIANLWVCHITMRLSKARSHVRDLQVMIRTHVWTQIPGSRCGRMKVSKFNIKVICKNDRPLILT